LRYDLIVVAITGRTIHFCISHPKKSAFHFNISKHVQLWKVLVTYDLNAVRADKRNPSTLAGVLCFLN
ncbi:hypothetical protein, partial [Vibrio harveyi]|uniref:hypothetical protein n=1 Tax=Vibrio harveyi TaxID=669 RepID=UPI00354FA95C